MVSNFREGYLQFQVTVACKRRQQQNLLSNHIIAVPCEKWLEKTPNMRKITKILNFEKWQKWPFYIGSSKAGTDEAPE